MKTLLRMSKLILPLFPVMALAVLLGTAGHLCAISIPTFGVMALTKEFPFKFLILFGVARGIFHYIEQYCNHYIAFSILARIRNIVFAKLRSLGPAKLEGKQKGNLIALITSDIELLEVFYAHTVSPVCIATLVSLTVVIFLWQYHFVLALVALASFVWVGVCIPFILSRFSMKTGIEHRERFSKMNAFLLDTLRGIQQTILYNNGAKKLAEIKLRSEELSKSQKKMARNSGIAAALIGASVFLCDIAMLLVSNHLYRTQQLDFNSLITSLACLFSSFGPVIAVANLGSSLSQTVASGKRVLSLLDEKPVVEEISNGIDITKAGTKNTAEISDVCFSYDRESILSDLSLDFPKNKIIGLQGKSGSGKSTILKLLMRFWQPQSGEIKICDNPIEKINTNSLRSFESYVTQETVLFHDTIENNIRIAKLDASLEEIKTACKKAAIHEFIESLPNGYQTQIAELGDNFSGGERQRLGLARAFLHNSLFIFLDEPTSNLDSYNEKIILNSVKAESDKKTVVLVSHRESTLEIADKVYKINSTRKS